ncbi:MAG: VTT domain-containing protein [Bacteroides sp.]|nr:VTT domain-containing protein [Bacteroides sp.]
MGEFIATFADWGYMGLFLAAFIAGSVVPLSSEAVLVVLLRAGLDPTSCILSATVGNTLGGLTCYWLGHIGKTEWIEKYLKVKPEKLDKALRFLQGRGAFMAFFAFIPYLGTAISIALGFMRSNIWITTVAMFAGKMTRYVLIVLAVKGIVQIL